MAYNMGMKAREWEATERERREKLGLTTGISNPIGALLKIIFPYTPSEYFPRPSIGVRSQLARRCENWWVMRVSDLPCV